MNIDQLRKRFPDEDACRLFFESISWKHGRICPHCANLKSYHLSGASVRKGVYQCKLVGISQKSAWKLGHAIRQMMDPGSELVPALSGIVELDEKYIGGKPRYQKGVVHKRGKGTGKQ